MRSLRRLRQGGTVVSADDEKAVDWYSFTTGYEAGAASRDAEVAAAKAEALEEFAVTQWGTVTDGHHMWDAELNIRARAAEYRSATTTEGNRDE
jgi:hypothetical protein